MLFGRSHLGRVVHAAVLGLLQHDDLEQLVVLVGHLPCERDVERQVEPAKRVEVRIHPFLTDVAFFPRPVRWCEPGAGVDDAAMAQPEPVSVSEPKFEELDQRVDRIDAHMSHLTRVRAGQERDHDRYVEVGGDLPHLVGLHAVGGVDHGRAVAERQPHHLRSPRVDAERHAERRQRGHDLAALDAIPEPDSLVELRTTVGGMLPRIDLSQIVLEVMGWKPGFVEAFRSWSGGDVRLEGLDISIAACLTAQAMNVGYTPMVNRANPALHRDRLSHVAQTYISAENMAAANRPLIERQADIDFAELLGGGLVAAVDGMRFVVPTQTIHARPNRRYFGRRKGVTWLNMINDQAIGLGARVVSGNRARLTPRDRCRPQPRRRATSRHHRHRHRLLQRPRLRPPASPRLLVPAGTGRHAGSEDVDHRPTTSRLRIAYDGRPGPDFARAHRAALADMLRIVGSIHTGAVRAYDIVCMLQRDGRPTPLGDATSSYGRIFKSLHMLDSFDNETYRRDIKGIRNLQEGRHALAQRVFHGRKGELFQRYHEGMEDQLGALGLVVNCVVLWNTYYIDLAIKQLRADEDVARLSPYVRSHVNVHGTYSFSRPDTSNSPRPLRDPTTPDLG